MRTGDSIVIDPVARKVVSVEGEPVKEQTPEMKALVEEVLGPEKTPRRKVSEEGST